MKGLFVIAFACVVASAIAAPKETYTDRFDNIDLDEILASDRLLKNYVDCLLDKGRCSPDGKTLKDTLPDALENECSKCTEKQKSGADKVIRHLVNKKPDLWKLLGAKYDKDGEYVKRYKDIATGHGITV